MSDEEGEVVVVDGTHLSSEDALKISADHICFLVTTEIGCRDGDNVDLDFCAVRDLFCGMEYNVITFQNATSIGMVNLYATFKAVVENNTESTIVLYYIGRGRMVGTTPHMISCGDGRIHSFYSLVEAVSQNLEEDSTFLLIADLRNVDEWESGTVDDGGKTLLLSPPRTAHAFCFNTTLEDEEERVESVTPGLFTQAMAMTVKSGKKVISALMRVHHEMHGLNRRPTQTSFNCALGCVF